MFIEIQNLNHEGEGVGRLDGKAVFVAGALPNETVRIAVTEDKKRFAFGRLEEIIRPAPERVTPACPHYQKCGGCSWQHISSDKQMIFKEKIWLEQMKRLGKCEPQILLPAVESAFWHYRSRARLAWDGKHLGFKMRGSHRVVNIQNCLVLPENIANKINEMEALLRSFGHKITAVEVSDGADVVVLNIQTSQALPTVSFKNAVTQWTQNDGKIWQIRLQNGKNVRKIPSDAPELSYQLGDLNIHYQPDDFTQINQSINAEMVRLALEALDVQKGDKILDLFCGLGNFTLPLAQRGAEVLGIEGVDEMVERGRAEALRLNLTAKFERADLFQIAEKQIQKFNFYPKWLLDPPRAGAQELVSAIGKTAPERLVYVSCNPSTLARDAGILISKGYVFRWARLLNMFPQTAHVESLAVFER